MVFKEYLVMKNLKNPNNRKRTTPSTSGSKRKDNKLFTSYDTSKEQTATPQKVREGNEPTAEQTRLNKSEK
jgi:hypothetical protein